MFGGNRGGGLLGGLLGGGQSRNNQPRRGGLLNHPLGRMAMMAGAAYLGNKFMQSRGGGINTGGLFGGNSGGLGGLFGGGSGGLFGGGSRGSQSPDVGGGSDTWGNNKGSGGQSW